MLPTPLEFLSSSGLIALLTSLLSGGGGLALGVIIGVLIPRSRVSRGFNQLGSVFLTASMSSSLKYVTLFINFLVLVREIWCHYTQPGTFRACLHALGCALRGKGFKAWPHFSRTDGAATAAAYAAGKSAAAAAAAQDAASGDEDVTPELRFEDLCEAGRTLPKLGQDCQPTFARDSWYVTERDLGFFRYRVEHDGEVPGAGKWEKMMERTLPGGSYTSYRRMLPEGKTEYRSTTVFEDATAQEMMDFYLDDDCRERWDSLLASTKTLEDASFADRRQVIHWVRTFPFSFIKQRDYVIARRLFKGHDGTLYGITKGVNHPRMLTTEAVVRCDLFYSMWSCRTIPCPRGSDRPACVCTLLHLEDFKIPERLARFAVSQGMWGFIKKMMPFSRKFVDDRRTRAGPFEADPKAFGAGKPLNPPTREELALLGLGRDADETAALQEAAAAARPSSGSGGDLLRRPDPPRGGLRRVGSLLVASCAAIVLAPPGLVGGAAAGVTCAAALVGTAVIRGGSRNRNRSRRSSLGGASATGSDGGADGWAADSGPASFTASADADRERLPMDAARLTMAFPSAAQLHMTKGRKGHGTALGQGHGHSSSMPALSGLGAGSGASSRRTSKD